MPRPVVVMAPPTAVALDPKGASGSRPRSVSSCSVAGTRVGVGAKEAVTGAPGALGRPSVGSVGEGGVASAICGTNTPVEASRLAA